MSFAAAGGRRFVLAVFVFCVCVVLLWCGKLAGELFAQITMVTVGSLIAGHTVEAVKKGTP